MNDRWSSGEAYEGYVGRWSRLVAEEFLEWMNAKSGARWLDVGCGTGELTRAIAGTVSPEAVVGVDPSSEFVGYAERKSGDEIEFRVGDAQRLPFEDSTFDATVSGLVLNFVPDANRGAAEMVRVTHSGGIVGSYVWDYSGGAQFMRHFWDAATELDPTAAGADEGQRFKVCNPEAMTELFEGAGLTDVETRAIDVPTRFRDFDDYWSPLMGGQGPAGVHATSLDEAGRTALRELIREKLPIDSDGSIALMARAWAVRGHRR